METEAAKLGITDAVAFTAPTARIAEAYAASNLVLQLSRKPEAFGRTVIEALSVGRPVIGWAHGGVGELLRELQPQGAVAPFDENQLLRNARALLAQAPQPIDMPYTLQIMQQSTLALYQELVEHDATR
jgi:glycosyltransferase involved in cell wall biosynthesis